MQSTAATTTSRWTPRFSILGLVVLVTAGIAGVVVLRPGSPAGAVPRVARGDPPELTTGADGAVTRADGVLPGGVTVFEEQYPGVANLDAGLLEALRRAATDAATDGIELAVNSGWRSPAYQRLLLHEAVSEYGSEAEAARWVATAATSPHVSGAAVDLGPTAATTWLSEHGAAYGLCQVYRNEPWHYELRPDAVDDRCPRMFADPTKDPRLQPGR